jgi:hypothetical protein
MNESKIQFSPAETELMNNSEIILTKNIVLQKIKGLLEEIIQLQMQFVHQQSIDHLHLFTKAPKISKGENYGGLPYLILDYPRIFEKENIMAIRNMFWWGNAFSITLHLSGIYKHEILNKMLQAYDYFSEHASFISTTDQQWAHAIEQSNYTAVKELSRMEFETCCLKYKHLKIAFSWPLSKVEMLKNNVTERWKSLITLYLNCRQYDEKGL